MSGPMTSPMATGPVTPRKTVEVEYQGERLTQYLRDQGTDPDTLKAFEDLIDSGVVRIPEALFVKHLLPLSFAEEGVEKDLLTWKHVTGSFTSKVHVVDARGDILFTCPGLHPELPVGHKDENSQGLRWAQLANDSILRNNIHPGLGENRLIEIGSKYLPVYTDADTAKHREEWEKIWTRYGVAGRSETAIADTVTLVQSAIIADELDEEDEI